MRLSRMSRRTVRHQMDLWGTWLPRLLLSEVRWSLPKAFLPWTHAGYTLAAWEIYRKHKPTLPWDLVALNPPFVSSLVPYSNGH